MFEISSGGKNWKPWATYPAKAQQHLGAAAQLVNDPNAAPVSNVNVQPAVFGIPGTPSTKDITSALTKPFEIVASTFKAIGTLTSHLLDGKWWLRVGQGVAALILLFVAYGIIFNKQITQVAAKAAPIAEMAAL